MNQKQIEKLLNRANSCICTYSPDHAKIRVDCRDLRDTCLLALETFKKPKNN